jgi:hypothetical protein
VSDDANVRKLRYLESLGGPKSRISEQADGSWAAVPASGPQGEEEISRGATAAQAAAARVAWLEAHGVDVFDPPDDFQ